MKQSPILQRTAIRQAMTAWALAVLLLGGPLSTVGLAATEVVPMERLHVHDVIYLPTVRSAYVAQFTKPRTWNVSALNLTLHFQHSIELLPHRSYLRVIVNDKLIKHIPLTRENADGTTLNIAIPVGLLKDFNTMRFLVEQHYTDKCEDPLDKSLWTQVLPDSRLTFTYTATVPKADLTLYPYPIIDPLTYSPAQVRYITSAQAGAPVHRALATLNVHLGQEAGPKEMLTRATYHAQPGPDTEHLVFVGTPAQVPDMAAYASRFGDYMLSGGRWVNRRTGQALSDDQGVIIYIPASPQHMVLVVSGNTEEAVWNAAHFLTTRPRPADLRGSATHVPDAWTPSGNPSFKRPRYVDRETVTFRELGFGIEKVYKIYAPPITYHVPVVSDFRSANGRLFLDLVYSYSPKLNPEFSSLEIRLNDVSVANIPLTNEHGERQAKATIPIPRDLIRVRNNLVAQFHMMPDKYGWCVNTYEDNAEGIIFDDSAFRVEGRPDSRLPDVGLLNNTMYPYSQQDHLQNMHLILPKSPSEALLDAMLGFTTRLGRVTKAENTDLRFNLSQGMDGVPGDRNLVVFKSPDEDLNVPSGGLLSWLKGDKRFERREDQTAMIMRLTDAGKGAYMQQYLQDNRVITLVVAPQAEGFRRIGTLFESDKAFDEMQSGFIQQLANGPQTLNAVETPVYHTEQVRPSTPGWMPDWLLGWTSMLPDWLRGWPWGGIILGMLAGFFLLLVIPIIRRRRT